MTVPFATNTFLWHCRAHFRTLTLRNHNVSGKKSRSKNNIFSWRNLISKMWNLSKNSWNPPSSAIFSRRPSNGKHCHLRWTIFEINYDLELKNSQTSRFQKVLKPIFPETTGSKTPKTGSYYGVVHMGLDGDSWILPKFTSRLPSDEGWIMSPAIVEARNERFRPFGMC